MKLEQIKQGIDAKFEKCRLVFWHDEDIAFEKQLTALESALNADEVEVIKLDERSHLEIKRHIEMLAPTQKFLLYSNKAPGEPTRDWLFDIRLYAQQFYADACAIILNELSMRMEFRQDIQHYKGFFNQQALYDKLKKQLPVDADKPLLELGMMAVLADVESLNFNGIVSQIVSQYGTEPAKAEEILAQFEQFGLTQVFWQLILEHFGYIAIGAWCDKSAPPSLFDFVIKLLITDCHQGLHASGVAVAQSQFADRLQAHLLPMEPTELQLEQLPKTLKPLLANSAVKRASVVGFVTAWRESRTLSASYNLVARQVAAELEMAHKLAEFKSPTQLLNVETFVQADEQLIKQLAKQIRSYSKLEVSAWVAQRLRGHWCDADANYACIYKALGAAKNLYELKDKYIDGFVFDSAGAFYRAYEQELYQFDLAYRIFCENAIEVSKNGSDVLKATGLAEDIEHLYVDWYQHDLAVAWGELVDKDNLLKHWQIPGIANQQSFYQKEVQGILKQSGAKRMFVIVSDAYRYECAIELAEIINNGRNYKAELKSQLGVVPSYTQLGMASLLPHNQLSVHLNNNVEYKVDGISAHGKDNRHKILQAHNGLACSYDEVMRWTNQEYRELTKDASVIYIYHNKVDAIGDDGATENDAFMAVRTAIEELEKLIVRIFNRFKSGRVILTADHGFLFNQGALKNTDKTELNALPAGTKLSKKRYLIGENLPTGRDHWVGKMSCTAGVAVDSDAEFMIPRGSNRFHFVGGAKFIHGGIMPQEIVVPVMHLRVIHSTVKHKQTKSKVSVVPLVNPIKIMSNIDSIVLLQTEVVGEHRKPCELEVWIEDSEGQKVSSAVKVLFDSDSEQMETRKRHVQIKLAGSGFDRTEDYKLIMEDTESKVRTSHSVIINLAFEDDFF